jgi:peptide/nickel transport system substrate-binding protein
MPERLAETSPYKPIAEIVGSGPYRFLPEEHISGARAAYERASHFTSRAPADRWASPPDRRSRTSIGSRP